MSEDKIVGADFLQRSYDLVDVFVVERRNDVGTRRSPHELSKCRKQLALA